MTQAVSFVECLQSGSVHFRLQCIVQCAVSIVCLYCALCIKSLHRNVLSVQCTTYLREQFQTKTSKHKVQWELNYDISNLSRALSRISSHFCSIGNCKGQCRSQPAFPSRVEPGSFLTSTSSLSSWGLVSSPEGDSLVSDHYWTPVYLVLVYDSSLNQCKVRDHIVISLTDPV